jgi:hypothetical protein
VPLVDDVHKYTETETAAAVSAMLNRLGDSVRTVLNTVRSRLTVLENGTAYTFTPTSGIWAASGTVGVLTRGSRAALRGAVVRSGSTASVTLATIGVVQAGARPPTGVTRRHVVPTTSGSATLEINAAGVAVVVWPAAVTVTAGVTTIFLDSAEWETAL